MSTKQAIPQRLRPKQFDLEDPQVSTDLSIARTYDPQQINTLQNLGLIKVDGERFKSLGELGRAAKSLGLINLIHGGFMVSVDTLTQAMGGASRIANGEADSEGNIPSSRERQDAMKLVGYLAGQLARANAGVAKVEQARAEVAIQADRQFRQSFAPGMAIPVESIRKIEQSK